MLLMGYRRFMLLWSKRGNIISCVGVMIKEELCEQVEWS